MKKRFMQIQFVSVTQGAADDAAQDVVAILVARHHAFRDQESGGANMVGNDAQGRVAEHLGFVVEPGDAPGLDEDPAEYVRLVVRLHALGDGRHAFESHARIDAGAGQGGEFAVRGAIILREHEVPAFQKAVALLFRRARRSSGDGGTLVVEDFRVRPAGTGVAHRPEVVRMFDNALRRHADFVDPEFARLVVGRMHRHPQPVPVERENAGDELPRPVDGVFLPVAAEAEVAEHFEQRLVAGGIADVFEIVVLAAGAHA